MKLSKREKIMVAVLLVIAAGVGYFLFIITPMKNNTEKLTKEVAERKQTLDATKQTVELGRAYNDEIESYQELWSTITTSLPASISDTDIITMMRDVRGRLRIDARDMGYEFAPADLKSTLPATNVKISLRAEYGKIADLVDVFLSDEQNVCRVLNLSMTPAIIGEEESERLIQATFTLQMLQSA